MRKCLSFLFAVLLVGCSLLATPVPTPTPTIAPTATRVVPTLTPTLTPTPTLEPFEQYTIDYLRGRAYGGGRIEVLEKISEAEKFTSYSIRYPSDGLTIYGFMNIPKGRGPFPVIVSVHGYSPVDKYDPFDPTQDSAAFLADNKFIVVHPSMRNYPPSDAGDNLLRVGMTIDVMNLIALLKQTNDLPGELANANADHMGLWGFSLGGEIALRIITISPDIKATVLYSSLSGDSLRNSKQLYDVIRDDQFLLDEQIPLELHDRISAVNYYSGITSAVQLHHGMKDETAPLSWAFDTCQFLEAAGVTVECLYYQKGHGFTGEATPLFRKNALEFYQKYLLP